MAFTNVVYGTIVNARYQGTNFAPSDSNQGVPIQFTGTGASASDNGWARPYATKLPAGSGAVGSIDGVALNVESAASGNRTAGSENILSVATQGLLKVKKATAPILGDIGSYIAIEDTAGTANGVVKVDASATTNPQILGITGTSDDDFLICLFK